MNLKFFYQNLLKNISHISENNISLIKTKLWSTYEKYSNVYVPYEYKRVVENHSKNDSIVIIKHDKGRSVVIIDKHNYTEKCLEILNTKQYNKIIIDPTKKTKANIQRPLQKSRTNLRHRNTIVYTLQIFLLGHFVVPLRYTNWNQMTK